MRFSVIQFFKLSTACLVSAILLSIPSQAANFITHYGITWTFSEDRLTGTFANGEPWVVGPISVMSIVNPSVPAGTDHVCRGGSMIDPIPNAHQGFAPSFAGNGLIPEYRAELNVALNFPFRVEIGQTLVTARSLSDTVKSGGLHVETVCVLTVLSEAPPAGSFRPGPYGVSHPIRFNVSDIDWSVLKNLAHVPATPTQAWIEDDRRLPALPWFEWSEEWFGNALWAMTNAGGGDGGNFRSNYGREISSKWSNIALWLNSDFTQAEKKKTMIQTIQCGIDIASLFANGGGYEASGGHQIGRKFPLLLAAAALKDPTLLAYASDPLRFIEDKTTFFVQQSDVGRQVSGGASASYIQEDVGIAEWGINHSLRPLGQMKWYDDRRWYDGVPYRFVQYPFVSGTIIAAELMGLKEVWNHPPTFAYCNRFIKKEGPNLTTFDGQMWEKYLNPKFSGPKKFRVTN